MVYICVRVRLPAACDAAQHSHALLKTWVCIDMCMDMCICMSMEMCMNMCIDTSIHMRIGMRIYN